MSKDIFNIRHYESLEHIEFNTFNKLGIFKNWNNRPFAIFIVHPALSIATTSMTIDNKHI